MISSQPRYDRFDTAAYDILRLCPLGPIGKQVQAKHRKRENSGLEAREKREAVKPAGCPAKELFLIMLNPVFPLKRFYP